MIRNDDDVKDRLNLIWKNLVTYYESSDLAQSNASLIATGLSQLHTSQFNSCMEFFANFLSKINS